MSATNRKASNIAELRAEMPETLGDDAQRFGTEEACIEALAAIRWPNGFRCPKCDGRESYRLACRPLWECKGCGRQTSATAGTVMHGTRTPLAKWFMAAFLIGRMTPGISAVQLCRQVSLSEKTGWLLLHKIRISLDAREQWTIGAGALVSHVEADETYVGGCCARSEGGRSREHKTLVAAAVEHLKPRVGPMKGRKARKERPRMGRVRLVAPTDAGKEALGNFIRGSVQRGALVVSDGWIGYKDLGESGFQHLIAKAGDGKAAVSVAPLVHRVFSNLKNWLSGTHHGVSAKHIGAYLREYEYRINRRLLPIEQMPFFVLRRAVATPPLTYRQLVKGAIRTRPSPADARLAALIA